MNGEPASGSVSAAIRSARAAGDVRVMLGGERLDRHKLRQLGRVFAERNKTRLLVDLLLADDAAAIETLDVAAAAFAYVLPLGHADELRQTLERRMRRTGGPLPWEIGFGRTAVARLPQPIRRYLLDLRHSHLPGAEVPLATRAELLAGTIYLPRRLIERLYGASGCTALDAPDWERSFRFGLALDSLTDVATAEQARALLDRDHGSAVLAAALAGPAVVLTFHGGFVRMVKLAYALGATSGARLQSKVARTGEQLSVADPRAALFGALRRLQAGDPILVAADAPVGRPRARISVLGRELGLAEGAAFLAHETRSPVFFLTVMWTGGGFKRRLSVGPRAAAEEPYPVFIERLHAFYAGEIERVLRGDPGDIAIRSLWASLLSAPD